MYLVRTRILWAAFLGYTRMFPLWGECGTCGVGLKECPQVANVVPRHLPSLSLCRQIDPFYINGNWS